MVVGAQSACPRFIIGETALNLAKGAFIHGMSTNGKGFSLSGWLHGPVYHAGESDESAGNGPGYNFT